MLVQVNGDSSTQIAVEQFYKFSELFGFDCSIFSKV